MTAVEWLVDQMRQRKEQGLTLSFYDLEMFASYAKAMEKEQIIEAWDNGIFNCGEFNNPTIISGKQYYNEIFKSE